MRVTLKTIADKTGLSITTVSRAIKDCPDVKQSTKDLVKKIADKLGYAPNIQGLSLRTGINYEVALLMPLCENYEIERNAGKLNFINGIISGFNNTPYHLTIIPYFKDEDKLQLVKRIVENDTAGVAILTDTKLHDECVEFLHEQKFPFVTFGQTQMGIEHAYVDIDQFDVGYRGATYLFNKGCKNIRVFLKGLEYSQCSSRYFGACKAAEELGKKFDIKNVYSEIPIDETTKKYTKDLIVHEKPDGIFFSCDIGALMLVTVLKELGEDVFNRTPILTYHSSDLLTLFKYKIPGYKVNLNAVGKKISEFVIELSKNSDPTKLRYTFKAKFIE